jgi:hypothetical protein
MSKLSLIVLFVLIYLNIYSQVTNPYKTGLTAEQNLIAIGKLSPNSPGGMGFDSRYEGVVGSPRLFDTLLPSFLKVKNQDYYIQVESDLDLVGNTLLFLHPKTKKLLSIPSNIVSEVIIEEGNKSMLFRTTEGKIFEKEIKGPRFYQLLKKSPYQFIKITEKDFVEADYKGLYTADRRYDEFKTQFRYYIQKQDSVYYQFKLSKKSLQKLFPDKKEIINATDEKLFPDDESMILSILEKF